MGNLEPIEDSDLHPEGKFEPDKPSEKEIEFQAEKIAGGETERVFNPVEKSDAYERILSRVQGQPRVQLSSEEISRDAIIANQKIDADSQVQHLVDLALSKGVVHAVKVARHMEENYVKDKFHDRMTADDLHDALIEKGLI